MANKPVCIRRCTVAIRTFLAGCGLVACVVAYVKVMCRPLPLEHADLSSSGRAGQQLPRHAGGTVIVANVG